MYHLSDEDLVTRTSLQLGPDTQNECLFQLQNSNSKQDLCSSLMMVDFAHEDSLV